jgi:flagellar hook protein FlgE
LDQNGFLVTSGGENVQGVEAGGTTVGNLQLLPPAGETLSSFKVDGSGNITMTFSDGTTAQAGQLYLANFNDPQALVNQSGNLYSNPLGTTNLVGGAPGVPGTNGTGSLVDGSLELSNVDLSTEMANLITAQQGFEANSKVVTTSSQMLQTVISMVQA